MYKPFSTTIIPLYNRDEILLLTIKSILNQTYNNWLLILVDNGPTQSIKEVGSHINDSESISYMLAKVKMISSKY